MYIAVALVVAVLVGCTEASAGPSTINQCPLNEPLLNCTWGKIQPTCNTYLYRVDPPHFTVCSQCKKCQHYFNVFLLIVNNINILFIREKMAFKVVLLLIVGAAYVQAQRPFYAGLSPIGFPEIETDSIQSRFGEDEPVAIELGGDRNLKNRLDQLPDSQKPFWYLNWKQYEELRKNPKIYPQKANSFIDNAQSVKN
ncbi:hypothetical protein K1T71_009837 [Dendrolimus kikuchii]|uniref:Uncharacterized protein n=1 Tax=Dendrolimus kikuchii TaxID=765133 RepID=A0ACC1CTI9_9NEOP|nr:hypothetical protein K1T71_009837 [Dendrolimus kikuchii]